MKIHDWKNKELSRLLLEKWGLAEKKGELPPGLKAYQDKKKGAADEPEDEPEGEESEELEEYRYKDEPMADKYQQDEKRKKDEERRKRREKEEKRSAKKEGLEEDCPPAELPAQGMDAAAPESEALTADDITDLQNLLDKLSNTLATEPGMDAPGGEAPNGEEEAPMVMRQEGDDLRETIRRALLKLREQRKI